MRVLALAVTALGLAAGAAAQTPSPRPVVATMQDRASSSPAEALFVEKCGMCHRELGMGTLTLARRVPTGQAMLEKRRDLSAAMISAVARNGLGNMPRIPRGEVSDAQLATIATYLATPRR